VTGSDTPRLKPPHQRAQRCAALAQICALLGLPACGAGWVIPSPRSEGNGRRRPRGTGQKGAAGPAGRGPSHHTCLSCVVADLFLAQGVDHGALSRSLLGYPLPVLAPELHAGGSHGGGP